MNIFRKIKYKYENRKQIERIIDTFIVIGVVVIFFSYLIINSIEKTLNAIASANATEIKINIVDTQIGFTTLGFTLSSFAVAAFLVAFTIAAPMLSIRDARIRENGQRLDSFYIPLERFIENVKEKNYKIEGNCGDEIKKLIRYKYLLKEETKEPFTQLENTFLTKTYLDTSDKNIPRHKRHRGYELLIIPSETRY